jgi:predicted transcriptional regulator
MAAFIIAEIFRRTQTTPAECEILRIISNAANVQGRNARIAYEVLARRSGYTVRWCMALVKRLEAKGILYVQRTVRRFAYNAVNVYAITRPWLHDLDYRTALDRRKAQQQAQRASAEGRPPFPSERFVHPPDTKREKPRHTDFSDEAKSEIPPEERHALALKWLTPGSTLYRMVTGEEAEPANEG